MFELKKILKNIKNIFGLKLNLWQSINPRLFLNSRLISLILYITISKYYIFILSLVNLILVNISLKDLLISITKISYFKYICIYII